jgi:hypothetical protein
MKIPKEDLMSWSLPRTYTEYDMIKDVLRTARVLHMVDDALAFDLQEVLNYDMSNRIKAETCQGIKDVLINVYTMKHVRVGKWLIKQLVDLTDYFGG